MVLAYALLKTGHPNCRRPDKVIDAGHPPLFRCQMFFFRRTFNSELKPQPA